jgi:hypothetical protein
MDFLAGWTFWHTAVQFGGETLHPHNTVTDMVTYSSPVVQGVLSLLFAFSVGSWAIIFMGGVRIFADHPPYDRPCEGKDNSVKTAKVKYQRREMNSAVTAKIRYNSWRGTSPILSAGDGYYVKGQSPNDPERKQCMEVRIIQSLSEGPCSAEQAG